MYRKLFSLLLILLPTIIYAQSPGDTIVVNTFNYGSTTRDTVINFPNNPAINYERVLMMYNIRCKNGLVSPATAGQTNIGCGEWDYSCNTYITDSSRVDSLPGTKVSHTISNYSGTSFPYTSTPFFNKYKFTQTNTTSSIVSETQSLVGAGTIPLSFVLAANNQSGRSQFLYKASELLAAGVTAGDIHGIILSAMNSASVNFLKIRMKNTSLLNLNSSSPDLSGFTETYFANTSFVAGNNRLQFNTAFNWDGVSNVLIDFSFTNSTPSTSLDIAGDNTSFTAGLYANNGHYINTASGVSASIPTTPFSSVSNQLTISFWSRGNKGVRNQNTSILEGVDNSNRRQLNIHHPWSNSNIYFDCGNNGSGYDRINKLADTTEIESTWSHWTFTKNTTTGIMNVYLNGNLWHTGTAKTFPITITSLILGANINNGNVYKGDIDELTIWNTELAQTDIQNWMNKSITISHPNYSNLIGYYKLDEGAGITSADASINALAASFGFTADWRYTRGDALSRLFTETTNRPVVTFLQGVYVTTNVPVTVYDSLQAAGNVVKEYAVTSNAGTSQSDIYSVINTNLYWYANYSYTFDGVTGALIDSLPVTATGTINITNLPFMDRYPSKFEIMSFVTPYGINLDLGMTGKTWTFDVTDYLPILKGGKRMQIERGGEWQENMDIKFLFLVGTPVREVKDIKQIWRQPSNCNYAQIMADTYFEPRNFPLDPTGKFFKIRNTVTGHGQEGEFIPRYHAINIAGGGNEFEWQVVKRCAFNPVYPQGGTWIYDRAGWCPGMASDTKEMDITPFVTPGTMANIDYHMLPLSPTDPAIGTSNYIVTNQLVTYGSINFPIDAAVVDIMAPTKKVEYARSQSICASPKIKIQNTGSTNLTSLKIEYWVNNNTVKSVFNWTGNLAALATEDIELPTTNLWVNVTTATNDFHVEVSSPNGTTDPYIFNNKMNSSFTITDVVPADFIVYHKSNLFGNETSYQITDESGNVLLNRTGLGNNTIYRDTMHLTYGCYKLLVTDTDEDGINFWANSDGPGIFQFKRINGTNLKTFNPDFGGSIEYNFTIDFPLTYDDLIESSEVNIYPNPASNQFNVEAPEIENSTITISNAVGQTIFVPSSSTIGKVIFNTSSLSSGIYIVRINRSGKQSTRKVVIE